MGEPTSIRSMMKTLKRSCESKTSAYYPEIPLRGEGPPIQGWLG